MKFYNKLALTIFLAGICFFLLILLLLIQVKISKFWESKFSITILNKFIVLDEKEFFQVHFLYQWLALLSGLFGIFFTIFISELIELYRAYKQLNLASSNA